MKTTLPLSVVIALAVSMLAPGAAAQRTYNFDVPAGKLERRADPIGRDVLPKRTKRAGPAYPAGLGTMNGVVHLQVTTEPSGQVAETRPLHFLTIGDQPKDDMKTLAERFAASAVAAVSRWEYEPTRKAMTFLMSLIIRPSSADGAASQATIDINLPETQVLKRLRHVRPVYPPMALSNGIQGVVIVEATVAPDGKVLDARVVRPIPFLDRAALEAVVQWEFEPFRSDRWPGCCDATLAEFCAAMKPLMARFPALRQSFIRQPHEPATVHASQLVPGQARFLRAAQELIHATCVRRFC